MILPGSDVITAGFFFVLPRVSIVNLKSPGLSQPRSGLIPHAAVKGIGGQ
jgi:hypothetical protein